MLIASFEGDPHVGLVTRHLDEFGCRWALLPTDEVGRGCRLELSIGAAGIIATANIGTLELDVSGVRSVWNRRQLVNPGGTEPAQGDPMEADYVRAQRVALLEGYLSQVRARWINDPLLLRGARSKLDQLAVAHALGLSVPRTLASDDPHRVRAFAAQCATEGVISKVISPGSPQVRTMEHQYMIFTQPFDAANVSDAAIAKAPAIYQERVPKAYEARAIVVGDQVMTCRIDSQASEQTTLDWRHYDFEHVAHTMMKLPDDVDSALLALCRHYGLVFAAIDLALTPDGTWTFFELNSNGQWGWLEQEAGLPIGRALAAELAGC